MNIGPVLKQQLYNPDVTFTHREGQVFGRGGKAVLEENPDQAVKPTVYGDAEGRAADVLVGKLGRFPGFEPRLRLMEPPFAAQATEIQS
ncbi:MAG: hypothetical protein KJ072_14205 [Verrucomicrobia bacterium]|nr:hypothetical protein [Verrucomicrobiota bacterium]